MVYYPLPTFAHLSSMGVKGGAGGKLCYLCEKRWLHATRSPARSKRPPPREKVLVV